jgi:hypothetical protein
MMIIYRDQLSAFNLPTEQVTQKQNKFKIKHQLTDHQLTLQGLNSFHHAKTDPNPHLLLIPSLSN